MNDSSARRLVHVSEVLPKVILEIEAAVQRAAEAPQVIRTRGHLKLLK